MIVFLLFGAAAFITEFGMIVLCFEIVDVKYVLDGIQIDLKAIFFFSDVVERELRSIGFRAVPSTPSPHVKPSRSFVVVEGRYICFTNAYVN